MLNLIWYKFSSVYFFYLYFYLYKIGYVKKLKAIIVIKSMEEVFYEFSE